jgi:hypothetical protein
MYTLEVCTLFHAGECRGGTPSAGSGGPIPPAGGSGGKQVPRGGTPSAGSGGPIPLAGGKQAPSGGSGAKPPKQKLPCKSIL